MVSKKCQLKKFCFHQDTGKNEGEEKEGMKGAEGRFVVHVATVPGEVQIVLRVSFSRAWVYSACSNAIS